MNIVHEQCSKSDSGTVLSPKTGSKTDWVHQVHSLLTQQHTQVSAGAPRRARVAVSQPAQSRVVAVAPTVSQARRPCCSARAAVSQRKGCRVAAREQASLRRVARHSPAGQAPYATIQNLALQYISLPALQPQS